MQKKLFGVILLGVSVVLLTGCLSKNTDTSDTTATGAVVEETTTPTEEVTTDTSDTTATTATTPTTGDTVALPTETATGETK